jgi:prepilin-type N-terminal cleavage/methylation domain-containing protein
MITALQQPAAPGPILFREQGAFTLIELLAVISIIAVLAGMVVGLAPVAAARMKEARVRGELAGLVTAIESYKSRFGIYPPDNNYTLNPAGNGPTQVDPVMNTLYYELTGALVDNLRASFITADDEVEVSSNDLLSRLGREGIVNALPRVQGGGAVLTPAERQLKRRLFNAPLKEYQSCEIFRRKVDPGYLDLELLAVGHGGDASGKKGAGVAWPLNDPRFPPPVASNPSLNPWRYVSTNPTNNPTSFDLWAEIIVKGERKIIGNWNN